MKCAALLFPAILSAQYLSVGSATNSHGAVAITYSHCKVVTVANTMVSGGSDLASYPLAVILPADADLATVANGGSVTNAGAANDIAFYSSCTGVGGGSQVVPSGSKLTWQIDSYSATSGALNAHVLMAPIHVAGDTIGMWFAGTATTSQSTASSVWSSAYQGVWHLGNGVSLSGADSTANANDSASITTFAATSSGQINGAASNATDTTGPNITLTQSSTLKPASALTVEAWVYPTSIAGSLRALIVGPQTVGAAGGYIFVLDAGKPTLYIDPNGLGNAWTTATSDSALSTNTWAHVVGVWNGTTSKIYVNGAAQTQTTSSTAINYGATGVAAKIGQYGSGNAVLGRIDEVRLTNTALTAAWITTEYRNQSAPATYLSVGVLQ